MSGPEASEKGNRRVLRALVVEDEPRMRELLCDVLPDMGFPASAARNAEEARRLLSAEKFDIVLLDLHLPGMNGMDFFEEIRRTNPQLAVIVITGFGDLDSAKKAIHLDVIDFLSKPFHLQDIEAAMDHARKRVWNLPGNQTTGSDASATDRPRTLAEIEKVEILEALARNRGNRTAAAQELGISRRTLHYRISEYQQQGEQID